MPTLVNPVQVEKHLKQVNYPATREHLIHTAKQEGANQDVQYTLERLPSRSYHSPVDVSEEIGKLFHY
jgi:hypothetical protein